MAKTDDKKKNCVNSDGRFAQWRGSHSVSPCFRVAAARRGRLTRQKAHCNGGQTWRMSAVRSRGEIAGPISARRKWESSFTRIPRWRHTFSRALFSLGLIAISLGEIAVGWKSRYAARHTASGIRPWHADERGGEKGKTGGRTSRLRYTPGGLRAANFYTYPNVRCSMSKGVKPSELPTFGSRSDICIFLIIFYIFFFIHFVYLCVWKGLAETRKLSRIREIVII